MSIPRQSATSIIDRQNRNIGQVSPRMRRVAVIAALAVAGGSAGLQSMAGANGACHLQSASGEIKHVIYIQFDNVHFTRDTPNVPSDLEQMPNLLKFMDGNGALITHEHTPLKSHTADDIITSLTGVYPDRH
jgi:hypothetical protein